MTPPSERNANVAATPRDAETDRLLHGRLHEPRLVLGPHARDDEVTVRVLRPDARRVRLPDTSVDLARVDGTALFEWTGPRDRLTVPYRIRWESHDGRWHEGYDP